MVCSVHAFVDPAGKLRELPNYVGRSWQIRTPITGPTRRGPVWVYRSLDSGMTLHFAGWAGVDSQQPFAGFTSPDLPEWVIYLTPQNLRDWCRELDSEPVKVRIADECGETEPWRLVQNSTGRVIRTFATREDAWFYQHHDSLYPVSEYTICGPEDECGDESKTGEGE